MSANFSLATVSKILKTKFFRLIILFLLSVTLVFLLNPGPVYAGQATLSWVAPSTNEDGTPLTDLGGYKIYYGTVSGTYTQNVDAGNVTTYTFNNLTDVQTYYFVATAYNTARFESSYSNEITKIITSSTQTYTLSVSKAGTGTGSVSSAPIGITCGADCSESYNPGSSISLTASPDTSSIFTGWSGACSGTGTCYITLDAAKSVTATFALKTYSITATASTGGSISPSGTVSVNQGSSKSFTITATSGYSIANVLADGASVGAVASYTFSNITATHTISASFNAVQQNSLNVTKAGTGNGVVTSSPAGISCGSDCTEAYSAGTVVTLTAVPDNSSNFGGWAGACTGSRKCTITMDAAKSVSPLFQANNLTITASAGNGGSISPSGTVTVSYGGSQSFTITPNANYTVGNVVVDGVSAGTVTSYSFTNLSGNHTINVSFTLNDNTTNVATNLPKSGQTSINASGDDGYLQAGTEWPAPRFTDNGDGTVTDTLTGLMWLKDGGCLYKSWSSSLTAIADFSDNPGKYSCVEYSGSYSDWRLPNMREIESLMNFGVSDSSSWLNSNGFKNVKPYYWVSTSYAASTTYAWMVNLMNGTTTPISKKSSYYMLPVRSSTSDKSYNVPQTGQSTSYAIGDDGFIQAGIEWPSPRFTDNGDGTVTDTLTGLMWLKDGGCFKKNWSSALATITDFNNNPGKYPCREYASDYSDWRLPNIREIESLVNYGASNSAGWINLNGFTNLNASSYWSSTTYSGSTSQAWVVDMKAGTSNYSGKNSTLYVLPVR